MKKKILQFYYDLKMAACETKNVLSGYMVPIFCSLLGHPWLLSFWSWCWKPNNRLFLSLWFSSFQRNKSNKNWIWHTSCEKKNSIFSDKAITAEDFLYPFCTLDICTFSKSNFLFSKNLLIEILESIRWHLQLTFY